MLKTDRASQDRVNKVVILLMALGISALFLAMIQGFLMVLFLAGLFSGLFDLWGLQRSPNFEK